MKTSIAPQAAESRSFSTAIAVAALLLGVHLVLGIGFIRSAAPTYDEPVHLASGYSYLKTGRYRLNIMDHPPLAEMWAAIPLLALGPQLFLQHADWIVGRVYHYSDFFLYHNRVGADAMISAARTFAFVTWTLSLALAILFWARGSGGDWPSDHKNLFENRAAGSTVANVRQEAESGDSRRHYGSRALIGAAAIYAFNPALLSNLSLATTDGGATVLFFVTLWLLRMAVESTLPAVPIQPSVRRDEPRRAIPPSSSQHKQWRFWAGAGVCFGLANAAKFNMIVLAPIALLIVFWDWRLRPKPRPSLPVIGPALFLVSGLFALMAVYRVAQFPLYWQGLSATLHRIDEGRSTFLLGHYSTAGFMAYFPAALAIKIPLAAWVLAAVGLWSMSGRERLWAGLPPLLYFAAAMSSKVQIGYRHVLPVIPFVVLWGGCGVAWLWDGAGKVEKRKGDVRISPRLYRAAAVALLVWQAGSVLRVHPHYLAYFNEAAGGPSRGYLALIDSNLDWGQDISGLAREVQKLGNPPIYLSYFGTADPAYYGLHYVPVAMMGNVERSGDSQDPSAAGRVLLAVSATNLQCAYFVDKTLFDWLKVRKPLRVIGYSIFLYDLTGDAEARRQLARLLAMSGKAGAAQTLLLKSKGF